MSPRKVRLSAAISLDGLIAGPNGEYDWIPDDPEIDMMALFKDFDTVLMGRKSYEAAKKQGHLGMYEMPVYVISSSLKPEEHPGVTVARDPAALVRQLRTQPGKDLWLFGGGELFKSFLALDLVDEMDIAVMPVLLGNGIPLLPAGAPTRKLTVLRHRVYPKSGTALFTYRIEQGAGNAATVSGT